MCNGALLEAFEPTTRASDVFCATAAKCGQTWLLTLMHLCLVIISQGLEFSNIFPSFVMRL